MLRFFITLGYLRPIQIWNRLWRLRPKWRVSGRPMPSRTLRHAWIAPIARPDCVVDERHLRFLNETRAIDSPLCWRDGSASRLWRYHLHYFDYLTTTKSYQRVDWSHALIRRWVAENPVGEGDGWEPYPSSLRIVNWIKWALAGNELDNATHVSLVAQVLNLEKRLEFHLLGNHLLENAKALIFAGGYFDTPVADRWLSRGLGLLEKELPEQILADGGHFERSPMYQAIVLEGFLDLVNLGRAYGVRQLDRLSEPCGRMIRWLRTVCHPDGDIALLNDSTLDGASSPPQLIAYARQLGVPTDSCTREQLIRLEPSGYTRMQNGAWVLIADAAPLGPDYQLAHGHADSLTFELSFAAHRVIVDTGVSTYEPGPTRMQERGTAAHNTVRIDGRDSSQVWKSFRVGRRANIVLRESVATATTLRLRAAHDGYHHVDGIIHRREWTLSSGGVRIRDDIEGKGEHELEWFLHLHPDCEVQKHAEQDFTISLPGNVQVLRLEVDSKLRLRIEPARYCPRFGVTQRNQRLVGTVRCRLPAVLQVSISTA